ncbi:MAG TPA: BON domain-containing protein [Pyrinomonadaceae bacterium]|jgi:hyperosmotically inducible protein|nr:BON domain-containing protein [Pyrinomonadaceae bacterium]
MKQVLSKLTALAAALLLAASFAVAAPPASAQPSAKSIRKALVMLPYYGVFDNLAYNVASDGTVTLYGQVVRPSTKKDAESSVKRVAGVTRVVNEIEVLPLSSFDDAIRARAYRTIFDTGGLYRYAMGANPSLHIVVNRGHLTLEGVVANELDRRLAYAAARNVSGAFTVTNNLRTDQELRRAR